jgi:hypothetical protein
MRIGSSSLNQNKPLSKNNIVKGIIPSKFKKFNVSISDEFTSINSWEQIRGTWVTDGNNLSTSTPSSSYPIISNFDLRSQNIISTMSLDTSGAGVVFWLVDSNNWWAGVTSYTQSSETYITGEGCNEVANARCWGWDGNRTWGCSRCVYFYNYGTRTRYNFYIKLLNSVNGVVSDITNILLRSTCSVSTSWSPCTVSAADNINGVEITTSGDNIIVRARDASNNYYGSAISYNAITPNKGYRSGVIFTPMTFGGGVSEYLQSSSTDNISIVGS